MIRIGHLLDRCAGWEQRLGIGQLLDRLPRDQYQCELATVAPETAHSLSALERPIRTLTPVPAFAALTGAVVGRFARRYDLDLICAWGFEAAAASAVEKSPLIVHVFDPVEAVDGAKLLRTIARPGRFAAACASEIVRRRLIEGGLDPNFAVTIRPGVDFNLLNRHRRGPMRRELGIERDDFVVTVPAPVTRAGGQFEACRAIANLHEIIPKLRLIVPGDSPEARRIRRFVATMPRADMWHHHLAGVSTESRFPFEQIVSNANALLVTPCGDISTTSIAWAMGAGVVVIGTAVYAVAEMISNKVNGMLFKHAPGRSLIGPLARCLRDHETHRKVTEVARGQAYEVFSVRRYVEQNMRLAENLLAGRPPADGITDSSVAV